MCHKLTPMEEVVKLCKWSVYHYLSYILKCACVFVHCNFLKTLSPCENCRLQCIFLPCIGLKSMEESLRYTGLFVWAVITLNFEYFSPERNQVGTTKWPWCSFRRFLLRRLLNSIFCLSCPNLQHNGEVVCLCTITQIVMISLPR